MSPFLLRFADGTVFFDGLTLCFVAQLCLSAFRNRWLRSLSVFMTIIGMVLVFASSTPLPLWLYTVWGISCGVGLMVNQPSKYSARARLATVTILFIFNGSLALNEMRFRTAPSVVIDQQSTIYILGDSISEGMGERYIYWPELLSQKTSCQVVNLAKAGSTVATAIKQAAGIVESDALVIIEIGGNDLLGDTDAADFYKRLDLLVGSLASEHQILMLELPLYPFQNAFGTAQRNVAMKYGIQMLPKKNFAQVLGEAGGTIDGLHLSQSGHDAMAVVIGNVITVTD